MAARLVGVSSARALDRQCRAVSGTRIADIRSELSLEYFCDAIVKQLKVREIAPNRRMTLTPRSILCVRDGKDRRGGFENLLRSVGVQPIADDCAHGAIRPFLVGVRIIAR